MTKVKKKGEINNFLGDEILKITERTYVIKGQVRMIRLDTVIQDGYDHSFARISFLPGWRDIHIVPIFCAAVLKKRMG